MADRNGTENADTLTGTSGNDSILGNGGNDRLIGQSGSDTIRGGTGNDTIYGDDVNGANQGNVNDLIYGDEGNDSVFGSYGNDTIFGGSGNDTLSGGIGDDSMDGGDDDDRLSGGPGNDTMVGGAGNDSISGGNDNDTLVGGEGNDTLDGGLGADQLTGGIGFDHFVAHGETAQDTITDFDVTGAGDKDAANNDYVDLSTFYNPDNLAAYNAANGTTYTTAIEWLRADQADGVLTQGYIAGGATQANINLVIKNGNASVDGKNLTFDNTNVVCFTPGVMIEAEGGARAVETLKAGDLVLTRDRGLQAVRWIGVRVVTAAELALDPALRPIRIAAGALGNGLPKADLTVSPMHRMVVSSALIEAETGEAEALIAARNLVDLDGVSVVEDATDVTYIHFMCDQHEVVIANGSATETLNVGINTVTHLTSGAYAEITGLFPELANRTSVPVRRPLPGDWGRNVARRHVEEGVAMAG